MIRLIVTLFYAFLMFECLQLSFEFFQKGAMMASVFMMSITMAVAIASVITLAALYRIADRQKQRKEQQP